MDLPNLSNLSNLVPGGLQAFAPMLSNGGNPTTGTGPAPSSAASAGVAAGSALLSGVMGAAGGVEVKMGSTDSSTKAQTNSLGSVSGSKFKFAGKDNVVQDNTTTYILIAVAGVIALWFATRG
jgi:hypothetical protein